MDTQTLVQQLCSATGGAGVCAAIVVAYFKHRLRTDQNERTALQLRLQELENSRLKRLENRLEAHIADCQPGVLESRLADLAAVLERVNNKLDRLSEDMAATKVAVAANEKFTFLLAQREGGEVQK